MVRPLVVEFLVYFFLNFAQKRARVAAAKTVALKVAILAEAPLELTLKPRPLRALFSSAVSVPELAAPVTCSWVRLPLARMLAAFLVSILGLLGMEILPYLRLVRGMLLKSA